MYPDIAILLFARSAEQEVVHKNFSPGLSRRDNQRIASELLQHSLKSAENSELPFFHFDEAQQTGDTFGERLFHAFQQVFDKGFRKVIGIGSDCAQICPKMLLSAAGRLENDPAVLGPATDGGVYLLGLSRSAFDQIDFAEIAWQTENVFEGLRSQIEGSIQVLHTASDIDDATDLMQLVANERLTHDLHQAILAILRLPALHMTRYLDVFIEAMAPDSHYLRGPPASQQAICA